MLVDMGEEGCQTCDRFITMTEHLQAGQFKAIKQIYEECCQFCTHAKYPAVLTNNYRRYEE